MGLQVKVLEYSKLIFVRQSILPVPFKKKAKIFFKKFYFLPFSDQWKKIDLMEKRNSADKDVEASEGDVKCVCYHITDSFSNCCRPDRLWRC
jgi:hypothetical protein